MFKHTIFKQLSIPKLNYNTTNTYDDLTTINNYFLVKLYISLTTNWVISSLNHQKLLLLH